MIADWKGLGGWLAELQAAESRMLCLLCEGWSYVFGIREEKSEGFQMIRSIALFNHCSADKFNTKFQCPFRPTGTLVLDSRPPIGCLNHVLCACY